MSRRCVFQKRVRRIAPKILQLLTEWTETFPYDFRDERMMRSLKELTHRLASGEEVSLAAVPSVARCLWRDVTRAVRSVDGQRPAPVFRDGGGRECRSRLKLDVEVLTGQF